MACSKNYKGLQLQLESRLAAPRSMKCEPYWDVNSEASCCWLHYILPSTRMLWCSQDRARKRMDLMAFGLDYYPKPSQSHSHTSQGANQASGESKQVSQNGSFCKRGGKTTGSSGASAPAWQFAWIFRSEQRGTCWSLLENMLKFHLVPSFRVNSLLMSASIKCFFCPTDKDFFASCLALLRL